MALVAAADPTRSRLSIIGWTPDGDSVAYYVVGRGLPHPVTAWIVARDGSIPRPWSVVPEQGRFFGWSADRAWMLIELPPGTADNTMRYLVARGDGTAPREIDSVGVLEWSRDRTVLLGTAGALTDLYHIGGLVIVIDPSGSLPPVKIETPGLLGMDWRSAG